MRLIVWLGSAAAALLIVVAAVIGLRGAAPERAARQPDAAPHPLPAPTPANKAASAPAATPPGTNAPSTARPLSFDIVTIDPSGQAVIAGRAMPGDRVRVLDGDKPVGEVVADARGEWALVPQTPIAPGNRQLGLEATSRDGGAVRRSADVVALSVTPSPSGKASPSTLAVLLPGDTGTPARILQRPDASKESQPLSLDSAEYGAADRLVLSGQADPGARLNVYAGERLLGMATADSTGKWSLMSPHRASGGALGGAVELRLDQLASDGSVARRIAASFEPLAGPSLAQGEPYVVKQGNSLWLIARQLYGHGTRYTAIFAANRDQIRDPHRIYPGQQFKLPPKS